MNDQEYHTGSEEIMQAFLAYKQHYSRAGTPSTISFVAGYNVALRHEREKRLSQALQTDNPKITEIINRTINSSSMERVRNYYTDVNCLLDEIGKLKGQLYKQETTESESQELERLRSLEKGLVKFIVDNNLVLGPSAG